jgi:hypothetical protein
MAYGLAVHRPDALVILIANDLGLMQRLRMLDVQNLCAIPLMALVQWSRTERKPPVVSHHLQAMRSPVTATASATAGKSTKSASSTRPAPVVAKPTTVRRLPKKPFRIPVAKIFFNLLTLAIVAIAALAVWRAVHPSSFNQFIDMLSAGDKSSPTKLPPRKK